MIIDFMKKICLASSLIAASNLSASEITSSPNGQLKTIFEVKNGVPIYSVEYKNKSIIGESALGFDLQVSPDLIKNFKKRGFKGKFIVPLPNPRIIS